MLAKTKKSFLAMALAAELLGPDVHLSSQELAQWSF